MEDKINDLHNRKIIDDKFFDWANALRLLGNKATHDSVIINKRDVEDLFEFTKALIDYIFILTKKFEDYKKRHSSLFFKGVSK